MKLQPMQRQTGVSTVLLATGKTAKGTRPLAKKLGVKDYHDAKVQAVFSDAEMERANKEGVKTNGKETMKPFGNKLSDPDIKALVAYIRSFKK